MTETAEQKMREFAQTRPLPLVPESAGFDQAPDDPVTPKPDTNTQDGVLPTFIPLKASDTITEDMKKGRAKLDEQAINLFGHYAQVINLVGRKRYNGTIVFLEKWNTEQRFFEARIRDGYTMLRLPFANQQRVDEESLEDEKHEDLNEADVVKRNIPYEADGQTKVIDKVPHMQTTNGHWRKVDAYGNFFVVTSKRPEHCVISMWKEWQRSNMSIRRRGLTEMKKLVDENDATLTQEVAVETRMQATAERNRADAIDKEKQKDLRAYRAQLAKEAKAQKELDK